MAVKQSTVRDYRERINRVIFHIERHLDEELSLQDLARLAFFSPFHFHRIFGAFVGETLGDFVRRLRLEKAAQLLYSLDAPVTEIALNAGYEAHAAFSRAFLAHFGISPTEFRQRHQPARLKGLQLLDLEQTELKEKPMNAEIKTVDPMTVLFVRRTGPYGKAAEEAFGVLCPFAAQQGLFGPNTRVIGISHDDPHITDAEKLRYDACVTVDRKIEFEGEIGRKTIAGGRYAVFMLDGPYDRLQGLYDRIYGEWLPQSGEQLRDEPCFEVYLSDMSQTRPEDLKTEVWIPIQ